ncbi:MAG: histidine kinase [Lachnospiraceae bacterium]|nr:histidine kinase [Lachnospiraceae bacterium]
MKTFIGKSFKRELLFGLLLVSLIPLVLCSVFLIELFRVKLTDDSRKLDLEEAQVVNGTLLDFFDDLDETLASLASDELIAEALATGRSGMATEVYARLYEETAQLREMAEFEIYSADGTCLFSVSSSPHQKTLPVYWGILRAALLSETSEMVIQRAQNYDDESLLLSAASAILDENQQCIGYVTAFMDEDGFGEILNGLFGNQDGFCILDEFLETVYSAGTAKSTQIGSILKSRYLAGESLREDYDNNRVYMMSLGKTGLYFALLRPVVLTSQTLQSMYSVLFWMVLATTVLGIFLSAALSGQLFRPIRALKEAMEKVQKGQLDTQVQMRADRPDELGELAICFNRMTLDLKQYMEAQVGQQKQLDETRIAMMQAQLNPHFLYNTLDTIKWVAKENGIPEIATLSARLARLLRTSISGSQFLSLREEMDLVDCYAQIQKIRFEGRFVFEISLPQELCGIPVPKLIVQPIVENAVIHGLKDCEQGHVCVRAFLAPDLCAETCSGSRPETQPQMQTERQCKLHPEVQNERQCKQQPEVQNERQCKQQLAAQTETRSELQPGIQNKVLMIEVTDDGCGMDLRIIEQLKKENDAHRSGHIGLYNVNTILRLYYGEAYGLTAERISPCGTKVTIRMPVRKSPNGMADSSVI